LTNAYTYVAAAPTLTSVSPTSGPVTGGTGVTLTGTNLFGAAVTFDGIPALSVSILSSTSVLAVAPPHAAGAVTVAATTLAGTASLTNVFTYVAAAPTLTSVSPTSGPVTGGTGVTLTGTNLFGAAVTFDGIPALSVSILSSTSVLAVAPPHAAGAVTVAATTLAGTASLTNAFTYVAAAPTLTSVSPTSGPVTGGTGVTLTGTNLFGAAVTFDGIPALSVSILSSTSMLAVAPPHAAGAVTVAATTLAGTASLTNAFTYVAA
ncbi:IPT/TIG domain-containing protein, partial [Variibacter gotjawalensis]